MKKIMLVIVFAVVAFTAMAQTPFIGIWEGKVTAGIDMRVVFTIRQDEAQKYIATMEVPDQGITGITSRDVSVNKDSIIIHVKQFSGTYTGRQVNDTTIHGEWKQGIGTRLHLKRVEKVTTTQRRQTPVPPFDYRTEDVLYTNKDKTIQYGATITMPHGSGPFPTVILITGSGQQNRDEAIAGHKPFAVIADYLTRNGMVVLRVDDRGMGQTTGETQTATTLDFSQDINTSIEYLKARKEVDKKRLVLIGHSEGGMIAQLLASQRKDIAAIVLLAAPGKSGAEVLIEQNRAISETAGLPKEFVAAYTDLYTSIIEHGKTNADKEILKNKIGEEVERWIKATPANIVIATTGIIGDKKKDEFISNFSETFQAPWFRYFLNFQPAQYLEKVSCKVLALNGSKDIQVLSGPNLAAIEAVLKKSKAPTYKVKEYEGLNHLFQHCKTCTVHEYGMLEETISVKVLEDIAAWLKVEVK
ncbi:MAG TPA: alpha/beta fold hydrolase [Chitinophagaceae bacterium]|nr:alpha/beta fold hydrolase [Chitinophagaceae bacterium]